MLEEKSFTKIEIGKERSFGLVVATFFGIIGLYPVWYGNNIHYWACIIAIVFFILSLFFPKTLRSLIFFENNST